MSTYDEPQCDGLCVTGSDIGIPGPGVAYPHPGCPLHDPGEACECGTPDRCLSPTHGQISMAEALEIRHRQNPSDPRARPCTYPSRNNGDGRGCEMDDCPRHGGEDR